MSESATPKTYMPPQVWSAAVLTLLLAFYFYCIATISVRSSTAA